MLKIKTTNEKTTNKFQYGIRTSALAAPPRAVNIGSHQGQKEANTANKEPASPIPPLFLDCANPII